MPGSELAMGIAFGPDTASGFSLGKARGQTAGDGGGEGGDSGDDRYHVLRAHYVPAPC